MTLQELIRIIYENDIPTLIKLKSDGVDFTIVDLFDGRNLLIAYSGYGYQDKYSHEEMIDFLMNCGIDINSQTNGRGSNYSALHTAISSENYELTKVLITKNANLEICDSNGNTPLWRAVMDYRGKEESLEIIKLLISKGASLDHKNRHDNSARDIIIEIGGGIDEGYNDKGWDLRALLK